MITQEELDDIISSLVVKVPTKREFSGLIINLERRITLLEKDHKRVYGRDEEIDSQKDPAARWHQYK